MNFLKKFFEIKCHQYESQERRRIVLKNMSYFVHITFQNDQRLNHAQNLVIIIRKVNKCPILTMEDRILEEYRAKTVNFKIFSSFSSKDYYDFALECQQKILELFCNDLFCGKMANKTFIMTMHLPIWNCCIL